MSPTLQELMMSATVIFMLVMFGGWLIFLKSNYLSFVDVVWAMGIGLMAMGSFGVVASDHWPARLALLLILLWSFRLSGYLIRRLRTHYPREDLRYLRLKEEWGKRLKSKTFIFFQFQALIQAILFYPFAVILTNDSKDFGWLEVLGVGFVVMGIVGEAIADDQLKKFKLNSHHANQICELGFWKYSRHPNYFFEWTVWIGFSLFSISQSGGLGSLAAPVLMYYLLNFVTGVKPSEEQSLRSKGDLYRHYQQKTNAFFPWFQNRGNTSHVD